jgi:hypothetical protein
MPIVGHGLQEPLKQHVDQVEGQHVGLNPTASGNHISQQRQTEWMPVCEAHHPLVQVGVDACADEQGLTVVRAEIAQRNHTQQRSPSRIGSPGLIRSVPAGDDDDRRGGQPRDEPRAEPVIERRHVLVGVDQQHQPPTAPRQVDGTVSGWDSHRLAERFNHTHR